MSAHAWIESAGGTWKKVWAGIAAAAALSGVDAATGRDHQQEVPIPTPCAPGPFITYFDGNRDEVTPQGAAILDIAAGAYLTCGPTRVWVAGHTDRSGSAASNLALSQRRADNVRAYLAARGIAASAIAAEGFGESRPLVETADGVREPQNRRVEVTFGPDSRW